MLPVFALAHECRLLPSTTQTQNGESIHVAAHWSVITVFGGLDGRNVPRMWSCTPEILGRDDSFESAQTVLAGALRHFPANGRDLKVEGNRVFSTIGNQRAFLRQYHLWTPPRDIVFDGPETHPRFTGRAVGGGIGMEWDAATGQLHLTPYVATLVHEEKGDGVLRPLVVPVRWMEPKDPKSTLSKDDLPLREVVANLHSLVREAAPIGSLVTLDVIQNPTPHYSLVELREDTTMAAAFKEARVPGKTATMLAEKLASARAADA